MTAQSRNRGAGLVADVAVAARGVHARVTVGGGEVVALLGPNGAGKSTVLSVVAGLLRPDRGRVLLDGRVLVDTGSRRDLPPYRRGTALLAQDALLFPHLDAAGNVAFPARARGASRSAARAEAAHWLAATGAEHLADRRPAQLSGGQAQRVALARALAARPGLLLLDEPLAAVDVDSAPQLRHLLREVLSDRTRSDGPGCALLVTHDVLDALALADRAVVLDGGRVVEEGPVADVLARPRSAFAASLAGLNLVPGTATASGLLTACGTVLAGRRDADCAVGSRAVAVFPPAAVAVHLDQPAAGSSAALPVTVTSLEMRDVVVRVRGSVAPLNVRGPEALPRAPGAETLPAPHTLVAEIGALQPAAALLVGRRVWCSVRPEDVIVRTAWSGGGVAE